MPSRVPPALATRALHARFSVAMTLVLTVAACGGPPPPVSDTAEPVGTTGSAVSRVTYSGPIIITKGGTYTGNWESKDPNVPAVRVQTTDPVTIKNANVRGPGVLIRGAYRNRVTIRGTRAYGTNPNVAGRSQGEFASFEKVRDLRIMNNHIEGTAGINVYQYDGTPNGGDGIRIQNNRFRNLNGMHSDGQGGYTTTVTITHAILLNAVRRVPSVDISWNEIINEPGRSAVEENINVYVSSGTPDSPIRIHDNYVQGAYNTRPATDASYAGGGILIGDGVTADPLDFGYVHVYDNQVVSTTNEGLAITGGVHQRVYNNRVVSSGRLPDGSRIAAQNVGAYMYDWNRLAEANPPTWAANSMTGNSVAWTVVREDGSAYTNPFWFATCGVNDTVCAPNENAGHATLQSERDEYTRWTAKVNAAGVKIGP